MAMPREPRLAPRPWRAAVAGCALALALLLLFQPLICVAHCVLHTQGSLARASGDASPFLCHAAPPTDAGSLLVPAFWPGVLPALIILVFAVISLRLPAPTPTPLAARPFEPPFPPPRLAIA